MDPVPEDALRASEERYRVLVGAFPDIIMVTSLSGDVLYGNKNLERATGLTPDRYNERPRKAQIHPDDMARVVGELQKILTTDVTQTPIIENRFVDVWGGVHWFSGVMAKIPFDGKTAILTVTRDITEQRALQEELVAHRDHLEELVKARTAELEQAYQRLVVNEKMAALGSLVAGISHEVNTPLGVSITAASYIQELAQALGSEDLNEAARLLMLNLTRAADLVESFKNISVDLTRDVDRDFELGPYLEEVTLSLSPRLRKPGIEVHLSCPPGLWLRGSPSAFSQIFTNLMMNTLLHGYDGKGPGRIDVTVELPKDGFWSVHYSDGGKGMGAEGLSHLFEPFFTTKRAAGGTGLGTYVVYNLVTQELGGSITAISDQGKGLRYEFQLPDSLLRPVLD